MDDLSVLTIADINECLTNSCPDGYTCIDGIGGSTCEQGKLITEYYLVVAFLLFVFVAFVEDNPTLISIYIFFKSCIVEGTEPYLT